MKEAIYLVNDARKGRMHDSKSDPLMMPLNEVCSQDGRKAGQMKIRHRWLAFLFPVSVFAIVFDLLRLSPNVAISLYAVIQSIILFIIIIILLAHNDLKFNPSNPTFLLLISFLMLTLMFSFFSVNVEGTLKAILQTTELSMSAFAIFLLLKSTWAEEYWIDFSTVMLIGGVLAALSIITDFVGFTSFTSLYMHRSFILRQIGILGKPNFGAGKLAILLPFSLLLWRYYNSRGKVIATVCTILASFIILTAIFLTGSRMGGMAAVLSILIFMIRELRQLLRPRSLYTIVITAVLVVAFSLVLGWHLNIFSSSEGSFILMRYKKMFTYVKTEGRTDTDLSLRNRAAFAALGFRMFSDHPVTGVGLGMYPDAVGKYGPYKYRYTHNTFISVLAETGFVGFIIFIALFFRIGGHIYQRYRNMDYKDFYFYLGLSFINLMIMLFFLSDFSNKYFWTMFIPLSLFWDYQRRFKRNLQQAVRILRPEANVRRGKK